MKLKDPHELLAAIDLDLWDSLRGASTISGAVSPETELKYVEPHESATTEATNTKEPQAETAPETQPSTVTNLGDGAEALSGKINRLGDYIDTDAVCLHV